MSRYIIKVVFLEKPKRPINWSGGSKIYICNKLMSGCISLVGMSCIHKKSKLCWFFLLGHLFFRSTLVYLVFHVTFGKKILFSMQIELLCGLVLSN